MLPNQGSNLDFTDPESVVLPITPLGIFAIAKIIKTLNQERRTLNFFDIIQGS